MNFDDTPQEALFRQTVRKWIEAHAPTHLREELSRSTFANRELAGGDLIGAAKAWQKRKHDEGWACIHWPKEYGGRAASPIERVIWEQEEGVYGHLNEIFTVGHGMCGPTIIQWASEELKRNLLPPLASGKEIWCQLFSEPASGSDLAGLRTRAVRDGEEWIINGQKTWTSGAQHADWGLLLARHDFSAAKHKGLTAFAVRMESPGLDIRPIRQGNGQASFNEEFFTDLRIPDSQRIGGVGDGWQVALTTLMNERLSLAGAMPTGFDELFEYCTEKGLRGDRLVDDPAIRSRIADFAVRAVGIKYTGYRLISALSKGDMPGPENSVFKLVVGSMMQELAMFAIDLQGQAGVICGSPDAVYGGRLQALLLRSPGTRVEGGTDEILRNIIGERVLGLPGDIRLDKGVPFHQIPSSGRASS